MAKPTAANKFLRTKAMQSEMVVNAVQRSSAVEGIFVSTFELQKVISIRSKKRVASSGPPDPQDNLGASVAP